MPIDVPDGTWEGHIERPVDTLLIRVELGGCQDVGTRCGTIEYFDPVRPENPLCAPGLVYRGGDAASVVFEEIRGVGQYKCLPMLIRLVATGPNSFDVERYPEGRVACCFGTLVRVSSDPSEDTVPPPPGDIDGFDVGASIDLGGRATSFTAETASAAFFPLTSGVAAVDFASTDVVEVAAYELGSAMEVAAHAVVAIDDVVWVARTAEYRLEPIGTSGAANEPIALQSPPTTMAADGATLWVASYNGNSVMRVNTVTGRTEWSISVHKPLGIAVGDDGVWVGLHNDDQLRRIDPDTNSITSPIVLGGGDGGACGLCLQNVVVSDGAVWTANNRGRSVTRVDTRTLETIEIPTDFRVWTVAAGGSFIWASQKEDSEGFHNHRVGGVARIDPATLDVVQYELPGVRSVHWHGDRLWLVVPGSHSDFLYEYIPVQ